MSGKKMRSNKAQIRVLVDFMSSNNYLSKAEFSGPLGHRRAEAHWVRLKELLKNYGPDRSIEQWKQTWKDLKKSARHENTLCAQANNTSEHAAAIPVVSEISKKILDTISHESSMGNEPAESAIGTISIKKEDDLLVEVYQSPLSIEFHQSGSTPSPSQSPSPPHSPPQPPPPRITRKSSPANVTKRASKKNIGIEPDDLLANVSENIDPPPTAPSHKLKYAAYGEHIAEKLRGMPPTMAIYCQKIINDAVFMAETNNLHITSHIVSESNK